jgi:peptide/nickel transport system permease protein
MSTDVIDRPTTEPAAPPPVVTTPKKKRSIPSIGLLLSVGWLVGLVILAVLADFLPFIRRYDTQVRGAGDFAFGPGNDFWFGSDRLGRDVFARCVYGARISLQVAVVSILAGLTIGGTLGICAGYFRGWTDRIISITLDILLAFPVLVFSILVVGRFDALQLNNEFFGWLSRSWSVTIVLATLSIAPIARIVRAQTLANAQREYVLAARSLGAKNGRILVREVLPNLVPAMTSVVFTGVAILLVAEGGLAFLGYSVKAPQASWGLMVAESRERIDDAWWATIFPCLMFFFTVLAFNVIGDRVARKFDIREAAL